MANNTRLWEAAESITNGKIDDDVAAYLQEQTYEHQENMAEALDFLEYHSTPAFREMDAPDIGSPIPVSFQEKRHIGRALLQLGRQVDVGAPDFRSVGYFNWPGHAPRNQIRATRKRIHTFIRDNPHVPFGYFEGTEPLPISIGRIRKLGADVLQPLVSKRALITGLDADMKTLNDTFWLELHDAYQMTRNSDEYMGVAPRVTHEKLPNAPNIQHIIEWFESYEARSLIHGHIEPGPGFGADHYRIVGGYDPNKRLGETSNVVRRIQVHPDIPGKELLVVPAAQLVLSPRRLVEKIKEGASPFEFWRGPGDFRARHPYRGLDIGELRTMSDITPDMHDDILRRYGHTLLEAAIAAHEYLGQEASRNYAYTTLESIRLALGGPEDMFVLEA